MAQAPSAQSQLRALQRKNYRLLERQARAIFGETPLAIRRYERECERDFRSRNSIATKEELIAAIRKTDITFVADYHTYSQAQRTALRLLREAVLPNERWALGLELISSQHQKTLDDFQSGRISLKRFHEQIQYREQWGFPWKNYEPLFHWAREHGVRLVALNRPKELIYQNFSQHPEQNESSDKDLYARDQWAAGILTDLKHQEPELRILVLYGGLHVGRAHLPTQLEKVSRVFLKRPLRSLSIHQNHAQLYWELAKKGRELHAQILKLNAQTYCAFSGTPWAQLQSLIGSMEGEDLESEEEADHLSLTADFGTVIAKFFGIKTGSFTSLSIHTLEDADFIETIRERFTTQQLALIRYQIANNRRIYLPGAEIAYLASASQNAAAEFAAIHLLRQHTGNTALFEGGREEFFRCVLEATFGFLGSLVLNLRRKCDLSKDHIRRLRELHQGAVPAFRHEEAARRLALEVMRAKPGKKLRPWEKEISARSTPAYRRAILLDAAHYVGQALAKNLLPVVLAEPHRGKGFRRISALLLSNANFEEAYTELLVFCGTKQRKHTLTKQEHL